MLKPYDLLKNILLDIENGIKNKINISVLSKKYDFSEGHISRLFRFAFNQSIAAYISSRTLAASLNKIIETKTNILDIAVEYGFEYEQSYIRAFKREFGITPGDLRKTGKIVKIKPPLHLFDKNKFGDSVLLGPDIVIVPSFNLIGKHHKMLLSDPRKEIAKQFWNNERMLIKSAINPNVYIGLTRNLNRKTGVLEYLPSVQIKNFRNIPQGLCKDTFDTSLCARFRYIGQHHYFDIDRYVAASMYDAIKEFSHINPGGYVLSTDKICFEKIDTKLNDTCCQMEWFTPVYEKN